MDQQPLIEVTGLRKYFPIKKGLLRQTVGHVHAVDGVSFSIAPGETLGLVGESGTRFLHGDERRFLRRRISACSEWLVRMFARARWGRPWIRRRMQWRRSQAGQVL